MRNFTVERATLLIIFILLCAIATRVPVDTDTWWHIRSGEYTLTEGMIHADPFSHTKIGERWINHSWGSQLVLYAAYQGLGNAGLVLYQTVLAVGGMALLYRASAGNVYLRGFVLILGAAAASVFWSARPQMISFFCNCLIMLLLYDYKRGGKDRLWWIVLLMLVWGNLHAGYSIGFIFLGALIVGESINNLTGNSNIPWSGIRKLMLVTIASVAVLVITPYGLDTLLVPFQTVGIGALRAYIQEWNSPDFQGRETWSFILLVLAIFGAFWGSRLKFDWTGFFLISGTFFMALLYGRNIAVFAVAAVPILTHHLDNLLQTHGWILRSRTTLPLRLARLNAALVVLVGAGVLVYNLGVMSPITIADLQEKMLPVKAVEYLEANHPAGKMFNSYNWGGYLMFAAPDYPVFIDGRTDLYGEFLEVYLDTALARNQWRETLDQYDIHLVVVEATSPLDEALRVEPGWTLAYQDDLAVIYTRS